MAHGGARKGKWRGNWRMQCVASTLHTTSEHGVSSITTADAHTSSATNQLNWRPLADLNGLVRFAERRNLVSGRVPSHFKRSLLPAATAISCNSQDYLYLFLYLSTHYSFVRLDGDILNWWWVCSDSYKSFDRKNYVCFQNKCYLWSWLCYWVMRSCRLPCDSHLLQ